MDNHRSLTVLLDTNVLLVSISSRSKYHWLYQAILNKKFNLAVTSEILTEYEEIIGKHWSPNIASNVIRSILELPNLHFATIYYHLQLITTDPDDDKFVDCAFASNADYIITHDAHFKILERIDFPKIPIADILSFKRILESTNVL